MKPTHAATITKLFDSLESVTDNNELWHRTRTSCELFFMTVSESFIPPLFGEGKRYYFFGDENQWIWANDNCVAWEKYVDEDIEIYRAAIFGLAVKGG